MGALQLRMSLSIHPTHLRLLRWENESGDRCVDSRHGYESDCAKSRSDGCDVDFLSGVEANEISRAVIRKCVLLPSMDVEGVRWL